MSRTYAAHLGCGEVLTYEAATFVPELGAVVPCRRHGFCTVTRCDQSDGRGVDGTSRTVPRRSLGELVACMGERPVTTIHALRRQRFTLRLIAAAQKDGLVDVDPVTGRVVLRPRQQPRPGEIVTAGSCPR